MSGKRFFCLFLALCLPAALFSGCAETVQDASSALPAVTDVMPLSYASQFSVGYCEGGYKLITLGDGSRFLTIPEGKTAPKGLDPSITPLYQPIGNIYLAATSAMCLFDSLDRLDVIRLSGTQADGWYIENARKAMEDGRIIYAGKYSAPDYELLTASNCPLAVESLMIGHASDIKDQLEALGIAVLVDQSSNETHPLGRAEWIKLYAALLDEEDKAEEIFYAQCAYLESAAQDEPTGKTAAFFYISSTGRIVARKSGDYVCKMIELAGGQYVFSSLGEAESRTSTVTLDPEYFYAGARDADILIYNAAISEELESLSQMLEKCELLRDFKAVQEGNVWCTGKSMYQESMALGRMIGSLHDIFRDEDGTLSEVAFFYRLT